VWICFNNSFVSIVQDKTQPHKLMVRARAKEHLLNLFGPKAQIIETPDADYRWRVLTTRRRVTQLMSDAIASLDYPNFKDSVEDDRLHRMYARWWGDHYGLQQEAEAAARPPEPDLTP
jgi:hypothetical protein